MQRIFSILVAFLIFLAGFIVSGACFYWVLSWNIFTFLVSILLSGVLLFLANKKGILSPTRYPHSTLLPITKAGVFFTILWITSLCIMITSWLSFLTPSSHLSALGPWQLLPWWYWFGFCGSIAGLLGMILKCGTRPFTLAAISLHTAMASCLLPLLFPLGYGFDPFLHQAAEQFILLHGAITPKTPYYIGHYIAVTSLAHILPLRIVDTFFAPILASITLPPLVALFSLNTPESTKWRTASLIGVLILPLGLVTLSTPWAHAALWAVIALWLGFASHNDAKYMSIAVLTALASCAIHPLAGIPTLGILVAYGILHFGTARIAPVWQYTLCAGIAFISAFLPAIALGGMSLLAGASWPFSLPTPNDLSLLLAPLRPFVTWRFSFFLDVTYILSRIAPLFMIFCALGEAVRKRSPYRDMVLLVIGVMTVTSLSLLCVSQSNVISYERTDFSLRILSLIPLVCAPFMLIFLPKLISCVVSYGKVFISIALVLFISCVISIHYTSYPTHDAYTSYHGNSVDQRDIELTHWIADDAQQKPYFVLANQMNSASAIREFGFLHYYPIHIGNSITQQFYYPLPTGSPLYQYYLTSIKKPLEGVTGARTLMNIQRGYVVIRGYEQDALHRVNILTQEATRTYCVNTTDCVGVFE